MLDVGFVDRYERATGMSVYLPSTALPAWQREQALEFHQPIVQRIQVVFNEVVGSYLFDDPGEVLLVLRRIIPDKILDVSALPLHVGILLEQIGDSIFEQHVPLLEECMHDFRGGWHHSVGSALDGM